MGGLQGGSEAPHVRGLVGALAGHLMFAVTHHEGLGGVWWEG